MEIKIPTSRDFSFQRTVISHGWCELLPFEIDREKWRLIRVIDLGVAAPVTVDLTATKRFIRARSSRSLNKGEINKVITEVSHIFRLDDNLAEFYAATNGEPGFEWVKQQGAGRMLRSPTVFEDLVKMICTTNCSWSLTEKMVTGLVRGLGRESDDGRLSFPTAAAMAAMPVEFFADEVRAGYRAPYLKQLSDRVASGSLNVEEWLSSSLSTAELIKQIKDVKGAGDYAAENLLKLLGRYDGLALDSWTRARFFEVRNNGRKASDKKIARYYSRFKEWRGLALWCDMTRDWLE